ncbi:lysine--tRNA ligase, chloroplastic/mitochondrial [Quercus suber]|uniref:lysine--tRNA ligase, chloroplastic/mitochondrial n=1 Tax=Quercus suber TaxID=58331 RepID=UPI0032DFA842
MFFTKSKSEFAKERRRNQSKKTKKGKAMEALRLWSLTTSQPLRHLFHLATSTTTTNSSARLVLRCSFATTSTTEEHNHLSSSSSCSSSSSSSTSDRDVIHTIHLKKVLGFLFDFPIMAIGHVDLPAQERERVTFVKSTTKRRRFILT